MEANRPELDVLRGKRTAEALQAWTAHFAGGDRKRAQRYLTALELFLGQPTGDGQEWQSYVGTLSPNTRLAYAYALGEFFEWLAAKHHRIVPPDAVTQTDAEQYTLWLGNRSWGLWEEKLRDGELPDRHAIYRSVEKIGSGTIRDVSAALPASLRRAHEHKDKDRHLVFDYAWLHLQLGRMVLHRVLARKPSMSELRVDFPRAGIDEFVLTVTDDKGSRSIDLKDVFTYSLPQARGVARTTIQARLAALSSFWDILQGSDGGEHPLVTHNVFYVVKRRVSRGICAEKKTAAAGQRMDPALVPRLLRTANEARRLPELRDKALLYLMIFMGTRVSEVLRLRRAPPPTSDQNTWPGWFDPAEPASLVVVRKGGKRLRLPYPPIALKALREFQAELERQAVGPGSQSEDPKASGYVAPDSAKWRYAELAIMPDAPLFPPLGLWGANSTANYQAMKPNLPATRGALHYTRAMTRWGASALLRRLATRAEMSPFEVRQVHPHALRHFALNAMLEGGKELRRVQAIAGHDSVQTTEGYLQDIEDPGSLSGQAEILRYLSQFEEPAGPTQEGRAAEEPEPKRTLVEATGIAVPPGALEAGAGPPPGAVAPAPPPLPVQIKAVVDVASLPPGPALPDNDLPLIPSIPEPPIKGVETGAGWAVESGDEVIEIGGKEPEPDQDEAIEIQMIEGKSAGSPDVFYDRMQDAQRALLRVYDARESGNEGEEIEAEQALAASGREPIEFTMLTRKQRAGEKVVQIDEVKRKQTQRVERIEKVQQNPWLREHYDPWPKHHGIGNQTLLPWFARGSPKTDGIVVVGTQAGKREVLPLPILSPEQVSPETVGGRRVMDFVEALHREWLQGDAAAGIGPSPSRAYGLLKWFGWFSYTTWKLERYKRDTRARADWQPWSAVCALGQDIRTHKPAWIEAWLRANSHTYRTTLRAFEAVPRGKALDQKEDFWAAFEAASFEGATVTVDVPEWFAQDDPIATLPPLEYERFAKWLANVVGQRLSPRRSAQRSTQTKLGEKREEMTVEEVKGNLALYFDDVNALAEAVREGDKEQAALHRSFLDAWTERFTELGLPDPASAPFSEIAGREERTQALIDSMLESRQDAVQTTENLFQASKLFDPKWFHIARGKHTIIHDAELRNEFREQFGQDSELLVRRAARGMWEHVKEHRLEEKKLGPGKYSLLHSIMLSYLAWIVPSGEQMEARMAAQGSEGGSSLRNRRQWLERYVESVKDLLFRPGLDEPEVETDADVLAAIQREYGLDEASAQAALQDAKIRQHLAADIEEEVQRLPFRGLEDMLGEAGGVTVVAPRAAAEERERFAREREEAGIAPVRVIRRKPMAENPGITVVGMDGETTQRLYRAATSYFPNSGRRVYLTPGAWQEGLRYTENARRMLPSAAAMIRAMTAP